MIYLLSRYLQQNFESLHFMRLLGYLSVRSIAAALTAWVIAFLLSRFLIRYLHRKAFTDQARDTGIPSAFDKAGTPTMGGLAIVAGVFAASLLWCDPTSPFVLCVLGGLIWFGLIGLSDDLAKFRAGSGDRGMSEARKLLLQFLFATGFALLFVSSLSPLPQSQATAFYVPFVKVALWHSAWFTVPFVALFVVLVSNSVNLTDGLDGLAIVPSVFTLGILGVFAYVMGNSIWSTYLQYPHLRGAGELGVFCSAFVGAGIGFLWYNAYPAELFMGDTGSLAIGGSMAVACVLLKQELLFPLLGGLFVAEAFTSQVQDKVGVRWLGRRLFYRAPLHHALQYRGLAETKVVIRLWIVSGILALLALATIKVR
jgi:phospho-N-acetylmuramoyl-pentapeptide-transferase